MIYTDTRDKSVKVDFKTAVLGGMNPKTGGLYIPTFFPKLDRSILTKTSAPSFRDIAFEIARLYTDGEIPETERGMVAVHSLQACRDALPSFRNR